jgi:hypothetical protein
MSVAITKLREQLREHFPEAHLHVPAGTAADADVDTENNAPPCHFPTFVTGVPALDQLAIPSAAITELVAHHASSGAALLTHSLLQATAKQKRHLALIDCHDHFDPGCAPLDACRSLLWLRCEDVESCLKAADLLLRDGNLKLIVADFQLESPRNLRSVPTSSWHRLRTLAEKTGTTFLCFTPAPLIPTARLRIELESRFSLDALNQDHASLLTNFPLTVTRRLDQRPQQQATSITAVAS